MRPRPDGYSATAGPPLRGCPSLPLPLSQLSPTDAVRETLHLLRMDSLGEDSVKTFEKPFVLGKATPTGWRR